MVEYQVMSNSSAAAQQIARSLIRSRVTDVVIAPGSRSAPLVYALAPLNEAGLIRTHVRIDERDAGFLALGLARGLRVRGGEAAVAIVTTSGSAVANLHPAVLEASYGHLPLLALTADRPARLRATGANQTIDDQSQVLSDVRARFDIPAGESSDVIERAVIEAVSATAGTTGGTGTEAAGPVQFNVQFDTPLVPTVDELKAWAEEIGTLRAGPMRAREPLCSEVHVTVTDGTVIVAGDAGGHSAETVRALAADHHLPVLAEPSSPLSRSTQATSTFVPAHARVLGEHIELRDAIRTVIVHGKPTLTRPVAALLADDSVHVQHVPDDIDTVGITVFDEAAVTGEAIDSGSAEADASSGPAWVRNWVETGASIVADVRAERAEEAGASSPVSLPSAERFQTTARRITEHLAEQEITLFVASSNSVRYLSDAETIRARIHASRGLAGIDGLVSTATGLSLGLGEPVVLLIGDIAMLHDVGGLLTPTAEAAGDVTIVVLNDDGGAIFSGLEHSQPHLEAHLERYFTVPHGRGFAELAAAYGWDYAQVSDAPGLSAALAAEDSTTGRRIVEVTPLG